MRLFAIDLLPEGEPESEAKVLFFTPSQPRKTWSWLAKSPFRSGYRYRPHHPTDIPVAKWSEVQSAFVSLKFQAQS
jgi:hypothetical protein